MMTLGRVRAIYPFIIIHLHVVGWIKSGTTLIEEIERASYGRSRKGAKTEWGDACELKDKDLVTSEGRTLPLWGRMIM